MQYRNNSSYAQGVFASYWFTKNMQGDIVGVYSNSGTLYISYTYDAWGNVTTTYSNGGNNLGAMYNPFKYRGYYHDSETGFYYLNSRYYDPVTGRFLNADRYISTGTGMLGYNMFAYCNNNPVNNIDPYGKSTEAIMNWWIAVMGALAGIEPTIIGEIVLIGGIAIIGGIWLINILCEVEQNLEETDSKAEEKTETKSKNERIYYGADARGVKGESKLNIVTGAMTYEEAVAWANATAESGIYGRDAPWGIYTEKEADAIAIGMAFGAITPYSECCKGGYMHYHLNSRNFGRYKHFHFWYGQPTGG